MSENQSLSFATPNPEGISNWQKVGLAAVAISFFIFIASLFNLTEGSQSGFLWTALSLLIGGGVLYGWDQYRNQTAGIKNNGVYFNSLTNRGVWGWLLGIVLTVFYISLYWYPEWIGLNKDGANTGIIALFDPLAQLLKGKNASQWFVYGTFYTLAILILGVKFLYKYRHSAYHFKRTLVVIGSQLFLAYFIPEILAGMNYNDAVGPDGEYLGYYNTDLKNSWPLDYDFFYGWQIDAFTNESYQPIGKIFFVWGILMFAVFTPVLTYFLGKRWYCSWVCGCGGLAETAGDPYRHLSDKSTAAWLIERLIIHGVLVFVVVMTSLTLITFFTGYDFGFGMNRWILVFGVGAVILGALKWQKKKYPDIPFKKIGIVAGISFFVFAAYIIFPVFSGNGSSVYFTTYEFQTWYGFFIGAAFSGVIGVGFYPLLGNRVWCRFGCPMAGYMGLIQRFKSRFRITTNGGQCISCGNCSTYCEQGIDVRAYAQKGENIVRASCVGCGVCAAVCSRGVLKLENGPEENRIHGPIEISDKGIKIQD